MGVQLNIKDDETVRLARKLAEKLGGSVTAAIRTAVEEKMASIDKAETKPSIEQTMDLIRSLRKHWKSEFDGQELSITHADMLYDDKGLPK
ncbi:MAG: type II toxin-antitoxin system VapB family antitoxin [Pseudomonadota bacterium]|jgi:antitoxin VapB|nr:type II toxin-antitoxin system VapB family antitoxin [Pseudomonadota bacterium]